jgi:BASS family bile acid:Na+ symporter
MLLEGVSVDPVKIARSLVVLMLLPLAAGLLVKARYEATAAPVVPLLDRVSTLSLALMMALIFVANFQSILGLFGTRGILASILFLLSGSALGWFLGGQVANAREVMTLGTAQRGIAAALVVADQDLNDPKVVAMVAVVAIFGSLFLFSLARMLAIRGKNLEV